MTGKIKTMLKTCPKGANVSNNLTLPFAKLPVFLNKSEQFGQNNKEQLALFQLYVTVLSDSLIKAAAMHGTNRKFAGGLFYQSSIPGCR